MRAIPVIALLIGLAAAAPRAQAADYRIDTNHSTVLASWEHFGFTRTVIQFSSLQGVVSYDPAKVAQSKVDVRIPM